MGVRFRRQEHIGPFIVDFACRPLMIVVELDGDSHDDPEQDEARAAWLSRRGWLVLRFWDSEVHENLEGVMAAIWAAVNHTDLPRQR
jgi:very-short-patch-repair endonuclease